MSETDHGETRSSVSPWIRRGLVALPVMIILIGGWSHRWAADDAYIDVRVVGNLLSGNGPVFNVGERVEVFTDPIWVGILALVRGTLGMLPTAWWAVLIGLACTAGGVALSVAGSARLGRRQGASIVIPAGMLCLVCVDVMWDFATSGLETGLIFLWIGTLWWLLVRRLSSGRGAVVIGLLSGLGPFIRPDLALVSLTFAAGLVLVLVRSPSDHDRRWLVGAAFVAPPLALELLRAAYFGMLLPNTALTKSAFTPWPGQGLHYLLDTLGPTWIWIPVLLLGALAARRSARWWGAGAHLAVAVLMVPVVAGLADAAYVVLIGGDFMHGRMLLPCLFLLVGALWLDPADRLESVVPIGVALFCAVALIGIRYPVRLVGAHFISNERSFYVTISGSPHPISTTDYRRALTALSGAKLAGIAAQTDAGTTRVFVDSTTPLVRSWDLVPGRRIVRARLVAPVETIGINGVTAGSRVYLFDLLSLANPIGSHLERAAPSGRPGHNDPTPPSWMVARFVPVSSLDRVGKLDRRLDAAERRQLACPAMGGYLHAITAPMTVSVVLDNLRHALTWTTLRIPARPRLHTACPS